MAPLLQLVAGQVSELERLAEQVGIARDQQDLLFKIHEGIGKTVQQIQAIEALVERAQGLDPREVRSLADLNHLLQRAGETKVAVETIIVAKLALADSAVERSALQSDTSYRMGQEMIVAGGDLARESAVASPGRATQISAAADSAQMLGQGVQLQMLSQLIQLMAMTVEFQKEQISRELRAERSRRESYRKGLMRVIRRSRQ